MSAVVLEEKLKVKLVGSGATLQIEVSCIHHHFGLIIFHYILGTLFLFSFVLIVDIGYLLN